MKEDKNNSIVGILIVVVWGFILLYLMLSKLNSVSVTNYNENIYERVEV